MQFSSKLKIKNRLKKNNAKNERIERFLQRQKPQKRRKKYQEKAKVKK